MNTADIIKTENTASSLERYEEVLLRRDSLRKKAEQYQISYFKVFGDLLVESFTIRVECIRKKKIIAYCQAQVNRGKPIDGLSLDRFIEREMIEYRDELDAMIKLGASYIQGYLFSKPVPEEEFLQFLRNHRTQE